MLQLNQQLRPTCQSVLTAALQVLEAWMVPDLWALVPSNGAAPYGERQLMLAAAKQGVGERMRQAVVAHRNSWVTERDFAM